jgi:hypothetical protein
MPEDAAEHLGEMYADERKWLSEFFAKSLRGVTRPGSRIQLEGCYL